MPKVWEHEVDTLKKKGLPESEAYAIATNHFKKKYGMTPQEAKKKGFEPPMNKKSEELGTLEVIASLGVQEPIEKKAEAWAALLTQSIGQEKLAEIYTAEKKDDKDNKSLKALLGASALGAGLFLGLRSHNAFIAERNTKLLENTEPLRNAGKYLMNAVGDAKSATRAEFDSHFGSIPKGYDRVVAKKNVQDVEKWIDEAQRNLRNPDDKIEAHNHITQLMNDLEDRNPEYANAAEYLRNKSRRSLLPKPR